MAIFQGKISPFLVVLQPYFALFLVIFQGEITTIEIFDSYFIVNVHLPPSSAGKKKSG